MSYSNTPFLFFPTFRAFDNAGAPLAGGKLYTYAGGTTTPQATYTDTTGATPNTNPVILDSTGSATIRLIPGTLYHFVMKDSTGATTIWDQDNYLPNGSYATDIIYAKTAAESAAGVTPTNYYAIAKERYAYVSRYGGSLSQAISVATTNKFTLYIDQPITVAANLTIPATMSLVFIGDGTVAVSNTFTLTVNGQVISELTQANTFTGSGTTTLSGTLKVFGDTITTPGLTAPGFVAPAIADGAVSTTAKIVDSTVTPSKLTQKITTMTTAATTSGTAIDVTGIPSWATRIMIAFNAVSTNGTSSVMVQLGSGSVDGTATYTGAVVTTQGTGGSSIFSGANSTGFRIDAYSSIGTAISTAVRTGIATLVNTGSNVWVFSSVTADGVDLNMASQCGGAKSLSGNLDRIRITSASGDTFDNGSVTVQYE